MDVNLLLQRQLQKSGSKEGKEKGGITLADCFSFMMTSDILDEDNQWFCPHCREFVCAEKKLDLWKIPDTLVLQLKRFTSSYRKLDTYVDFPDEIDMEVGTLSMIHAFLLHRLLPLIQVLLTSCFMKESHSHQKFPLLHHLNHMKKALNFSLIKIYNNYNKHLF